MAIPSLDFSVYSDGTLKWQVAEPVIDPVRPLYWVPHDRCRFRYDDPADWRYNPSRNGLARRAARDNNVPMPEVYRLNPGHNFPLNNDWQDLLCDLNIDLPREKALTLLTTGLAFCNIRFAVFDQPRIMGGATVTGTVSDGKLWLKTLRTDKPCPSANDVLADPTLWFWCVSVKPDGTINYWTRKGYDGNMHRCRMFLVSDQPVYIPLSELKRVDAIADPQVML